MNHICQSPTTSVAEDTYTYSNAITLEECITIAAWIAEENTIHGKHMLDLTPETLFADAQTCGCCVVRDHSQLIGCIFLMEVEHGGITLYERGSLFIHPTHRGKKLSFTLIEHMLKLYSHLPMYSVTNVAAIKKNNNKLSQHQYTKDIIPQDILAVFETPAPLLDDDVVYCNELLHTLLQHHA